jgi:hypothetical protein
MLSKFSTISINRYLFIVHGLYLQAKVQNTALRKILEAFRSAPVKAMQRDAEILPVNIRLKEILDRFAVRAIRAVSPRNPVWKLATRNKPAEGNLETFFARV